MPYEPHETLAFAKTRAEVRAVSWVWDADTVTLLKSFALVLHLPSSGLRIKPLPNNYAILPASLQIGWVPASFSLTTGFLKSV